MAEMAGATGLTDALSMAMAPICQRRRSHDPGRVLVDLAVMLADGGDRLSDVATLRNRPDLFGHVTSTPTAWRVIKGTTSACGTVAKRGRGRRPVDGLSSWPEGTGAIAPPGSSSCSWFTTRSPSPRPGAPRRVGQLDGKPCRPHCAPSTGPVVPIGPGLIAQPAQCPITQRRAGNDEPSLDAVPTSRPVVRSLITLSAVEDPALLRTRATKGARRARNALTPTGARQAQARSHDARRRRASKGPLRAYWSISQRVDGANGSWQPSGPWKQSHGRGTGWQRDHPPCGSDCH